MLAALTHVKVSRVWVPSGLRALRVTEAVGLSEGAPVDEYDGMEQ